MSAQTTEGAHTASAHGGHGHGHGGQGGHGKVELHLPHGSIWPFFVAIGISLFGLGLILYGHNIPEVAGKLYPGAAPMWTYALLGVGLVALVGTLIGWFVEDYKWWNKGLGTGEHIPKAGVLLFISSEVFLFGALFASYFTYQELSHEWPDTEVHLPLLKTAIFSLFLFASSYTVHKAEGNLKRGHHQAFKRWWLATIVLGGIFLVGQVMEYTNLILEGATLGSGYFITAFYMLTGTHGLHVFGGLCYLIIVYLRAVKGQFNEQRHAAPQTASMYWHFVDFVWVIVFSVVYLWNYL